MVEFQSPGDILRRYPDGVGDLEDGGVFGLLAGQPTDDSELALMLARSLVAEGRWDADAVLAAYVHWYESHPFDCGTTTAAALGAASCAFDSGADARAAAWASASTVSQANGALMRVSPLGIFGHATPSSALASLAAADAELTHPHPVCRAASALFAVTLAHAIASGDDPQAVYGFALHWVEDAGYEVTLRDWVASAAEPPGDVLPQMGWVRHAVVNAFHRLLTAPTLEAGVVETVKMGGDTDTNACIAGALLGAVHGEEAVPARWRDALASCRPEAGAPRVERPRPPEFWPVDAVSLADRLMEVGARAASEGPG